MSVDVILKLVEGMSPEERAELVAKLRERYAPDGTPARPAGGADQTGVYSLEQVVNRVRRGT